MLNLKRLIAVLAVMMAAIFTVGMSSAQADDFSTSGWWDQVSTTYPGGPGPSGEKYTYPGYNIRCNTDTSQPAWKAIYLYPQGGVDKMSRSADNDSVNEAFRRAASIFAASEELAAWPYKADGVPRFITWTDSAGTCHPNFDHVAAPSSVNLGDYNSVTTFLASRGYTAANRKYVVIDDHNVSGIGGESAGQYSLIYNTALTDQDAPVGNIGQGGTIAHEMAHAMGAVPWDAPHADGTGHTTAFYDLMSYGGDPTSTPACGTSGDGKYPVRMDCKATDYFFKYSQGFASARPSGYLSTHCAVNDSAYLWGTFPLKGQCSGGSLD